MIVDAVGVTETDLVDTQPLERKPTIPLDRLLKQLSFGSRDPDVISTIAGRIARLDRQLTREDREELEELAGMRSAASSRSELVAALDPDRQLESAQKISGVEEPSAEQIAAAATAARRRRGRAARDQSRSCASGSSRCAGPTSRRSTRSRSDRADRGRLLGRRRRSRAQDGRVVPSSSSRSTRTRSPRCRSSTASPIANGSTFTEIKELAHAIGRPPYQWTPETLWEAYETLDRSKVHGSGGRVLTDIVSLVRFALEQENELVPYPERVRERFEAWLLQQQNAGREFTAEQLAWLERIRDHVAASLAINADDFDYTPFVEQGGIGKAYELFGEELSPLLDELNEALAA